MRRQPLLKAHADVDNAGKPLSGAELLRQQQALQSARDAVPAAQADADRRNTDAAAAVTTASQARDRGEDRTRSGEDRTRRRSGAGAIDPDTELPYTAVERSRRSRTNWRPRRRR